MSLHIGIDLGGTKIEGRAFDGAGVELDRIRVLTPREDYDGTVRAVAEVTEALENRQHGRGTVGVGIPGSIVRSTGLVKNANSTWLNGRPIERDLSAVLGREVRCANDANCLALSEATDGAGAGYPLVFAVILGTGCGGGLASLGQVHAGPNGLAGEWGHNPLPWAAEDELPGPACYCGKSGCIEMWVSGPGLEGDFARATGRALRGPEIVQRSEAGDAEAEAALQRLESRLGRSLASICNVLDPDCFVLGGGLSQIDRLYTKVPPLVSQYTFGGPVQTPLLRAVHGDASGVRGAAWLWHERAAAYTASHR